MKLKQKLAISYIRAKFRILPMISKRRAAEKAFEAFSTPFPPAKKKAHPENAERLFFPFDGLTIRGYRWNHPQTRKALLLHGFGSASHKFEYYAKALAANGYEVLAFDAPAHGESEGKTANALVYSEMIKAIVEKYGPIQSFIAHSFGGLAVSLAMEQLPHDANTKMVLIAPATETSSAIDDAFRLLQLKDDRVRKEFESIIFEKSGKQTDWFSVRRAMNNITATILWIHDETDAVTPWADALKVQEDGHKNVEFVVTKGLGHQKIYHDQAVKDRIVDFLK